MWIADAHRDGKRFMVPADEKLPAFLGLESAIRSATRAKSACYENLPPDAAAKPYPFRGLATQLAPQRSQAEQTETEQRNCGAAIRHPSPSDDEREVLVR